MELNFKEKMGEFTLIQHSEIITYNDKDITIILNGNDETLQLKIKFKNQGGRVSKMKNCIDGDTLTIEFLNFEQPNSMSGVFEPIQLGIINNIDLYFNCAIYTLNAKDGNRLVKYSFWTKE